jgi:hypothetical protein
MTRSLEPRRRFTTSFSRDSSFTPENRLAEVAFFALTGNIKFDLQTEDFVNLNTQTDLKCAKIQLVPLNGEKGSSLTHERVVDIVKFHRHTFLY